MLKISKFRNNQNGFASIVIAMVIIVVLSLLTVGFAELMRSNENQTTNKQVSSQAYYAAESGINMAEKAITSGYSDAKTQCPDGNSPGNDVNIALSGSQYLMSNKVGEGTGATYPCLLINPAPNKLEYTVGMDAPKYFEMTGVGSDGSTPTNIGSILISWQNSNSTSSTSFRSGTMNFPPSGSWGANTPGVLQAALTPLFSSDINRTDILTRTANIFLYPENGSPNGVQSVPYTGLVLGPNDPDSAIVEDGGAPAGGEIVSGNCASSKTFNTNSIEGNCAVLITGIGRQSVIMDLRAIYNEAHVTITAYASSDGSGSPMRIKNAQTQIDSTGLAQGEEKRIQVMLPAHNNYPMPADALQTGSNICKEMQVYPTGGNEGC